MSSSKIRKISYGGNYPNGSVHFISGETKRNLKGVDYIVDIITEVFENEEMSSAATYIIYLKDIKNNCVIQWKKITGIPVVIEYNTEFN